MSNNKWGLVGRREFEGMNETSHWSDLVGSRSDFWEPNSSVSGQKRVPVIGSDARHRTVSTLCDSLSVLGVGDFYHDDLLDCPESVLSLIWKMISECNRRSKAWDSEKEKLARCENDNKLQKARLRKLNGDMSKLRSDIISLEMDYRRKEDVLHRQLEELGRNRSEWEKAAMSYKGREQKFVAEVKRYENDYERLRDKMKRSISMSGPRRGSEGSFHQAFLHRN